MYIELTADEQRDIVETLTEPSIKEIGRSRIKLLGYESPPPNAMGEYRLAIEFQVPDLSRDTLRLIIVGYVDPTSNTRKVSEAVVLQQINQGDLNSPSWMFSGDLDYKAEKLREYGIR